MKCPPKIAFLPYPRPCLVCGRHTKVQHHAIPYGHFRKGKAKGDPNRKSNVHPMCTAPMYVDSCHETLHNILGHHPYMGTDRTKRRALGQAVAKLLSINPRFSRVLAAYQRKAYREFGGDE